MPKLLGDVANITVATGHRYVWRGVKDANYGLHSALERRLNTSGTALTADNLVQHELDLLSRAKQSRFDDGGLSDAELLALLQHAGASTPMLDVTPDPFVALFFATEPVGDIKPCALLAIKVPGKTVVQQAMHTHKGPLADGDGAICIYARLREIKGLRSGTTEPILWEAPFVDDRMRAQRGMFLATTAPTGDVPYGSFDCDFGTPDEERQRVEHLCNRSRGQYTRPSVVVFYIGATLRVQATRELDQRFGYRTETIYPDLAGFALANAANRGLVTAHRA